MDIDHDPNWPRYETASDALSEARHNFQSAEHNYMLALRKLRQAEIETKTIWDALVERASQVTNRQRGTAA